MYRLWLDPERGFMPARFEKLMPRDRSDFENLDGTVTFERVTTAWKEVEEGLWFPSSVLTVQRGGESARSARIVVDEVRTGADADVPSRVFFPYGTSVTDEIARVKYLAGVERPEDIIAADAALLTEPPQQDAAVSEESVPADASPAQRRPRTLWAALAVATLVLARAVFMKIRRARRRS